MADIAQRFDLDMLTLTGPIEPHLAAQGVDTERDAEFMALLEPETVRDAYRLQMAAGTQVLVTATSRITPARLARHGMEDRLEELAVAALTVAKQVDPQHMLIEIGPCGLPLDVSSAASMKEHRDQYARVARVFEALGEPDLETGATAFDGYLLRGFARTAALKAAVAGIRKVSDRPVFACVDVDGEGRLGPHASETVEEAVSAAVDFGADVVGFSTAAAPDKAAALVRRVASAADVPIMVELLVERPDRGADARLFGGKAASGQDNPYTTPESMLAAAVRLRAAGAQFLRAGGKASPAYTAVLLAATDGSDVIRG